MSTTSDGEFQFKAEAVARELEGDADVVTIATGDATDALENLLPPKTHVYNGAARYYPLRRKPGIAALALAVSRSHRG